VWFVVTENAYTYLFHRSLIAKGKEFEVTGSALASRPHDVICLLCEAGELFFSDDDSARCTTCRDRL
jgi:hypothetical protein